MNPTFVTRDSRFPNHVAPLRRSERTKRGSSVRVFLGPLWTHNSQPTPPPRVSGRGLCDAIHNSQNQPGLSRAKSSETPNPHHPHPHFPLPSSKPSRTHPPTVVNMSRMDNPGSFVWPSALSSPPSAPHNPSSPNLLRADKSLLGNVDFVDKLT